MTSFGLYFGATNCCLAVSKEGKMEVLANDAGDRVTPSVVSFVGNEISVGLPAKQQLSRNAKNTVCYVKQSITNGEATGEIKTECKLILENGPKYEIDTGGKMKYYTPEDILVLIFRKMLDIAKSRGDEDDRYATVLTVPLYFTTNQRKLIRDAAIKAGFNILRVISEPSAALLAYNIGHEISRKSCHSCHCLVCRMGGTSTDVTVILSINGIYRVVSYVRNTSIGGNAFTDLLVDYCIQEFQRQHKVDIRESKRSVYRLRSAVETCKNVLTNMGSSQCSVESLYEGIDFTINIGRARFESLINNKLQESLEPIQDALKDAALEAKDIDKVILAGGSSKIPRLQQMIGNMFGSAEMLNSISPDEVIALGAASEAALLTMKDVSDDEVNPDNEIDVTSKAIYVKTTNEDCKLYCLIASGTPIPTEQQHTFSLNGTQDSVCTELYEGDTNQLKLLAKLVLREVPIGADVMVSVNIRSDGSVQAVCTEKIHNKSESVLLEPA